MYNLGTFLSSLFCLFGQLCSPAWHRANGYLASYCFPLTQHDIIWKMAVGMTLSRGLKSRSRLHVRALSACFTARRNISLVLGAPKMEPWRSLPLREPPPPQGSVWPLCLFLAFHTVAAATKARYDRSTSQPPTHFPGDERNKLRDWAHPFCPESALRRREAGRLSQEPSRSPDLQRWGTQLHGCEGGHRTGRRDKTRDRTLVN